MYILYSLKTSFFIFSSLLTVFAHAQQNNSTQNSNMSIHSQISSLNQNFEEKLNMQSFLKSTQYYADGYIFYVNSTHNVNEITEILIIANYRERLTEQSVLSLDFKTIPLQECSDISNLTLKKTSYCLHFKNSDLSEYILIINENKIEKIYNVSLEKEELSASTDPILLAQYRDDQPLLQEQLKIANYPTQCLKAIMAIEDQRFLEHSGISLSGLARAFIKNIIALRKAQGGSTITQQLVKNYFLSSEKTLSRKAKEIYLSLKLENQWSKDEILETYLNVIYMGQNGPFQVRGYGAASQFYFNKKIEKLNLAECALLAAIVNNPKVNNPWKNPTQSLKRRRLVLDKMQELKLISKEEYANADQYTLPKENKKIALETAPYFFDAVRNQARELNIPIEGTRFYTSLNINYQNAAQISIQNGLSQLTQKYKFLQSIKEKKGQTLQGVILTANNESGLVTAFVGGENYKTSQFNRALNSKRQIGSLIKPFVYLAGLDDVNLNYTPLSTLDDSSFSWNHDSQNKTDKKNNWQPENYDHKFRGNIPYFYALKESLNVPTARLAQTIGMNSIIKNAQSAGFTSPISNLPSSSLGASEHSPLEVLQAYSTLANLGKYKKLSFIKRATTISNEKLYDHQSLSSQNLNYNASSILVGMLKENIKSGTGQFIYANHLKNQCAGKTGTTSNGKDSWFAGFTPYSTTVVWIGFDQGLKTHLSGASAAVPIWFNALQTIGKYEPIEDFSYSPETEYRDVKISYPEELETQLVFKK